MWERQRKHHRLRNRENGEVIAEVYRYKRGSRWHWSIKVNPYTSGQATSSLEGKRQAEQALVNSLKGPFHR